MILSYAEVEEIHKFLETLDTCDYLGVKPTLLEDDVFLLRMISGHLQKWLRENE